MKPRRFWIAAPFVVAGLACGVSVVRIVFDFHAEMMEAHPAAAATVPANFVHNTLLQWHAGAARYYENRAVRGVLVGD